jgi:hypothetical protein
LICGVGAKLIPMFLLSKSKKNWLLYSALALQNLGLVLVLCHGYFRSIDSGIIPFATLIILGLVLWATYITDIYRHRLRKKVDTLMKQTLLSFTCIPLAIVTLVITFNSTAGKWTSLYGTLIFLGWITGIILGKTFKTLPFIIWNNKYKDIHGSAKIPLPKNLYSERLTNYQTYLFVIALAALSTGLLSELAWILQAATLLWIALAVLYCYNVATVIFHKKTIDYGNTI